MPDSAAIIAGPLAPLIQLPLKIPGVRFVMEKFTGIDRRRPLPAFSSTTLARKLQGRSPRSEADAPRGPVILFNDTYANYMEPEVGVAAVELLEAAGFSVTLANAGCCQRPRLSKGLVREAKELGVQTLRNLDGFAREGLKIVCLEPSCASALVDDIPDLCDDGEEAEMGQRVSKAIRMIDVFLDEEGVELESSVGDTLLHGHCHQKAMFGTASTVKALGDGCTEVDSGCCGMAGSFGYEHMDVSEQIGEDRLFPAVREATSAGKTIVAPGLSCRHQMHDFLDVEAKHFVQAVRVVGNRSKGKRKRVTKEKSQQARLPPVICLLTPSLLFPLSLRPLLDAVLDLPRPEPPRPAPASPRASPPSAAASPCGLHPRTVPRIRRFR